MPHALHPDPNAHAEKIRATAGPRWRVIFPRILTVLALLTLVFGTFGYYQYLPQVEDHVDPNKGRLLLNSFYYTVQLFALHSGFYHEFVTHPPPAFLEIARWTGAAASLGAVIYALTALFLTWLDRVRIRRTNNPIIVCGLGLWAEALIRESRRLKRDVVVVEKDSGDALIPTCANLKVPLVIGDARSPAVLSRAGINKATELVAFTNDDATNIEITLAARDLLAGSPRQIKCHAHVVDRELMQAFDEHTAVNHLDGGMRVLPFDNYRNAARQAVADAFSGIELSRLATVETVHLIVLGLSAMGESLVLQAVRNCQFKQRKFRVTVIDPRVSAADEFLARYPALEDLCQYTAEQGKGTEPRLRELIEAAVNDPSQLVFVAVCFQTYQRTLDAVLRLSTTVLDSETPVYAWLSGPDSLARMLTEGTAEEWGFRGDIRPFGIPEDCAGPDVLMRPEIDKLAAMVHNDYRLGRLEEELTSRGEPIPAEVKDGTISDEALDTLVAQYFAPKSRSNMLPWDQLPQAFRNSSRFQADHLPLKLLIAGWYRAEAARNTSDVPLDRNALVGDHGDMVEALAEIEHARWVAERLLCGWTLASKRNDKRRLHPNLVPWDELTEEIKGYDRKAILAIPRQLERVGQKLFKAV